MGMLVQKQIWNFLCLAIVTISPLTSVIALTVKVLINYIFIPLTLLSLLACSTLPDTKSVTTPYGTYEFYHYDKQAPVTVIFESGLGDTMNSWHTLIPLVEQNYSVFAYNRAGFNGSSSVNDIRDSETISLELMSILKTLKIEPPYVLVGHSLGGIYMQTFLKQHPNQVEGVLLIDSVHPDNLERCRSAGGQYCEPGPMPSWAELFYEDAISGELQAWRGSLKQAQSNPALSDIPLTVIYAGKPPWGQEDELNAWQEKQWQITLDNHVHLATLSSNAKIVQCLTCGHYIHQEKPELVMSELDALIQKIKQ